MKKILEQCVINVGNIILGYAMMSWVPAHWSIASPVLLRTFTYSQGKGRVCIIIQDCHVWPTVRTSTSWVLKREQSSSVANIVAIATSQWDSSSEFPMDLVSFFNLLHTPFPPVSICFPLLTNGKWESHLAVIKQIVMGEIGLGAQSFSHIWQDTLVCWQCCLLWLGSELVISYMKTKSWVKMISQLCTEKSVCILCPGLYQVFWIVVLFGLALRIPGTVLSLKDFGC